MRTEDRSWWPGLDGLRAVAVVAVLVYHQSPTLLPGGYLGVSLFFTLSGFLLTSLVLAEHDATGAVGLRSFWARRIRRLLPIALLGLGAALVVTVVTVDASRVGQTIDDIRFAALDVANWRFVFRRVTYADALAAPTPVLHYWSLAIEEQFYVIFPVVAMLALRQGRRVFAIVLGAVVAFALARQLTLSSFDRIYYGTDTRVAELAIGCLAAVAWRAWSPHVRARATAVDVAAVIAAVGLGYAWLQVGYGDSLLVHGGLVVHAVLSSVLIVAAICGRVAPRVLGVRPLVALGRISYGIYVFHFPLYLLLTTERTGLSGGALFVGRVGSTVAVAAIAHVLVESPVRWGGVLPRRQGALAALTALVSLVVIASGVAVINRPTSSTPNDHVTVSTMTLPTIEVAAAPTTTTVPASRGAATAAPAPVAADAPPSAASRPPVSVPRLLVIGDSTGQVNGLGMQHWATSTGAAEVDVAADFSCAFLLGQQVRMRSGWEIPPRDQCLHLIDDAVASAARLKPDAIVLFFGSIDLADWQLSGDTQWRAPGDPVFDAKYVAAANDALTRLESVGVPVLMADVAVPSWDPDVEFGPGTFPGSGPATMNSVPRTDHLNQLNSALVAAHPLVTVIRYAEGLERPDRSVDPALRPDGLHLAVDAVVTIMNGWLLDDLIAGYRTVATSVPQAVQRPTTWATP